MSGLGEHDPAFVTGGGQVAPNEIDRYEQYVVTHPSITDVWFGTVSSAAAGAFVLTNVKADYPRNLVFVALGVAGGMGGTAVVNGKNQFGETISETLSFGSAAGGGTVGGTKIFAEVSSGTFTPVGLGGTAVGTAKLGVCVGTASGNVWKLGLPTKIGATADVKSISWSKEGVQTTVNGGTISSFVDTTQHAISGSAVMGGTEVFNIRFKSTWSNLNKTNMAAL